MKLLSCKIENFGKLHEMNVDFTEGLNVILRENGYGKSTLAAFIRIMFYGLQGERKTQEVENDRKKYAPWQGGTFGGQLSFTTKVRGQEKSYRIVRTFGARKAQDHFSLYDAVTGLISSDFTENIGEELFHIDEASFRRTFFIGQNEIETDVTSEMSAKIGNVASDLDDMKRYSVVMEKLKNEINALSPSRRTGEIFKKRMELELLRTALHEKPSVEQRVQNAAVQLHQAGEHQRTLVRAVESIQNRMRSLAELQEQERDILTMEAKEREVRDLALRAREAEKRYFGEDYDRMQQSERDREIQETLHQMDLLFRNGIPQDSELNAHEREISRMEFLDHRRVQITENLGPARRNRKPSVDAPVGPLLLGMSGLLFCMLLLIHSGTGAATLLPGIAVLLMGVLFCVLYIRKRSELGNRVNRRYETAAYAIEKLDEEREHLRSSVTTFLGKYYPNETEALRRDQNAFSASLVFPERDSEPFASKDMDFDFTEMDQGGESSASALLRRLSQDVYHYSRLEDLREMREECVRRQNEIREFRETHHLTEKISRNAMGTTERMDNLSQRLTELTKEQGDVSDRIVALRSEKQQAENALDILQRKEREYEIGLDELHRLENRYHLLILTRDHLSEAKDRFTAVYLKPMMAAFTKYYHILTGTEELQGVPYQMDAAFNVHLIAAGQERNTNLLSQGFQNLVELCRRMAFIDAMYPEERPFVLLDDPFVNLDEDKIKGGLHFLETVAGDGSQVIYFTCHDSRK